MKNKPASLINIFNRVIRTRILRNLLLLTALILITFPLANYFIIYPQFHRLIIIDKEADAEQLAIHMARELHIQSTSLSTSVLTDQFKRNMNGYMTDFGLTKVKLFEPDGRTFYSTDPADTGVINDHDYFHNQVAAGETYSKVAHENAETLEGDITQVDVAEIYVPIMNNGRFLGAFELYYDISAIQAQLDAVNRYSILILMVIVSILTGIIGFMGYKMFHSEERLRKLSHAVKCSPTTIMVTDQNFRVTYVNPTFSEMTGIPRANVLNQTFQLRPNATNNGILSSIRTQLATGNNWHSELANTHADGQQYWEKIVIAPVKDETDQTRDYVILREDITARKQAEAALSRQMQYFQALVSNSPIAIVTLDLNGRITSNNSAFCKLFGFENQKVIGRKLDTLISPPEMATEMDNYTQTVRSGQLIQTTSKRRRSDGKIIDVEIFGVPVIVDNQQVGILGLYQDITKRLEYETSLQKAKQAAEETARAKSEFLANMSHEIRTPLNGVIGMTGLLLDTPLSPEQTDFVETIRSSGDSLLTIINDILNFSKIEAGQVELENEPFQLTTTIEEVLDLMAPLANKKELELAYLTNGTLPTILIGDVTRLRQILVNLMSNAIKFTSTGEIVISVLGQMLSNDRYQLYFAVKDTGMGIPKDRMDRLFKSFSQVDASTTRRFGGTGLGLAISKSLCELMGGSIWVDSKMGQGSTFHFSIQVGAVPDSLPALTTQTVDILKNRTILIVDDNETNQFILSQQSKNWGMEPKVFSGGPETLDWLRQGNVCDIAVLDMQMPDMDGLTLATEIQKIATAVSMPLIMFSSLGTQPRDNTAKLFAAYLTKPIKPAQLRTTLAQTLGPQKAQSVHVNQQKPLFDVEMSSRHPLRILLAEDNLINKKVALRMLQKLGYRADVAANGLEAIEAVRRQPYDVILMDIQMPEMDGLTATHHIRSQPTATPDTPWIIALTANALEGDREHYLDQGMNDYISKPMQATELIQALANAPNSMQTTSPMPSI